MVVCEECSVYEEEFDFGEEEVEEKRIRIVIGKIKVI